MRRIELTIAGSIFLCGAWFLFGQIIASKFEVVPGDLGDNRLVGLLFEHGYRFLRADPWHRAFWSPNWAFFPHANVLAYSENLLGTVPIYALARLTGLRELAALDAWVMAVSIANFVSMFLLLRELRQSRIGAALGGFLFAFSMPRGEQLNHLQLFPQFFTPLCFLCLAKLKTPRPGVLWAAFACVVLQIYSAVYVGWFLALALGIFVGNIGIFVLVDRDFRTAVAAGVRRLWRHVIGGAFTCGVALLPIGIHYLRAQAEVGPRQADDFRPMLPRLDSYRLPADYTFLYPSLLKLKQGIPAAQEHVMFAGYLALVCGIVMVVTLLARPRNPVRNWWKWVFASIWILTIVATLWKDGGSLWIHLYRFIPGSGAIRAVSRIVMLQLLPLGAAAAFVVTKLQKLPRVGLVAAAIVAALVVLENSGVATHNFPASDHYSRVARLQSEIEAGKCQVFYVTGREQLYKTHTDAMWASLESKVPTINGYSGNTPAAWPFDSARDARPATIKTWLGRYHRNDPVCVFRH